MKKRKILSLALAATLVFQSVFATNIFAEEKEDVKTITILSTSDLHGRIYPWEYSIDTYQEVGLAKVSTVIKEERAKDSELILVDTGDSIESNMINLFNDDDIHPMIKGLNSLDYDTWTLGNHEFNFGLDVLENAIDDFEGVTLSANIINEGDDSYYVSPYTIVNSQGVDIALVGLTAPYIKQWEASTPEHFEGLDFLDPAVAAQNAVDLITAKEDVDLIIGVFHIGYSGEGYDKNVSDNAMEVLEAVEGFDAAFLAHAHAVLGDAENQLYVNDTIVLEPGFAGAYVGKLEIDVKDNGNGEYEVVDKRTSLISTKGVEPDAEMLEEFKYVDDESKTAAYEVIGYATADFLPEEEFKGIPVAQIEDTAVIDLINEVQQFYAGADVSAAALFDTRSDLKEGDIQFKDAALIYKYSNTLQGHKINGAQLKEYMEWSATFYNTIEEGDLTVSFNPSIRGYNYDMFSGVEYEIDLSKEPGNRIINLTMNGEEVKDDMELVIAINNYRVGTLQGLGILPKDGSSVVYDSVKSPTPEMQRLIQRYIVEEKGGIISPEVDNNWSLVNAPADSTEKKAAQYLVNNEYISIPTSEDGRTANVESINALEKIPASDEIELLKSEKLSADVKEKLNTAIEDGKITNYGQLYTMAYDFIEIGYTTITPVVEVKPDYVPEEVVVVEENTTAVVEAVEENVTETAKVKYIVIYGDTLSKIAMEYDADWKELAELNDISNPNLIYPGQVIYID